MKKIFISIICNFLFVFNVNASNDLYSCRFNARGVEHLESSDQAEFEKTVNGIKFSVYTENGAFIWLSIDDKKNNISSQIAYKPWHQILPTEAHLQTGTTSGLGISFAHCFFDK